MDGGSEWAAGIDGGGVVSEVGVDGVGDFVVGLGDEVAQLCEAVEGSFSFGVVVGPIDEFGVSAAVVDASAAVAWVDFGVAEVMSLEGVEAGGAGEFSAWTEAVFSDGGGGFVAEGCAGEVFVDQR